MVIRNFKYTAEDVDCQYCTEFRHGRCQVQKCPWLKERIEAGVLSYREAVNEAFKAVETAKQIAETVRNHVCKVESVPDIVENVDIEAERRRIIINARRMIPRVPPPRTSISTAGITASIPPSGRTPPRISLDALPTRYAAQPIIKQNTVDTIVPLLIAAVSLIA
mgnify:CR=1 FL=1